MKTHIFCIYDDKAKAFLQPFFQANPSVARRSFSELANDRQHAFCKHAGDFTLFHMGEFDDQTGEVTSFAQKHNLGTALIYKNRDSIENVVPADFRESA